MRALRRFLTPLANTAMRRQNEERLREEFEEHLALQTAEDLRSGFSPLEARRQAVLKFGAVESFKEEYRDQQGLAFLEALLQDARYALRRLRKARVHPHYCPYAGAGHRRDYFDFHAGRRRCAEVAGRGEARRTLPPGKRSTLLLLGRVHSTNSPWSPTNCINTFGTTPRVLRN